jgi:hypothetical protein
MFVIPPKEIANKIKFNKEKVIIKDGEHLTLQEKELFYKFKSEYKEAFEDRFR